MSDLIKIGVSARHVHLSREHIDILFGPGHQLRPKKYVYQPGQFAAEETVDLITPKATFNKVRVLGPERSQSQVEISLTDAHKLGLEVPVRESGDHNDTPGVTLIGPNGIVVLPKGVIVAWRHIHMSPEAAAKYKLKDRELVEIECNSKLRPAILGKVIVRVHESFLTEVHIDTDEANAVMLANGDTITIRKC